jgi:hypothetical protein
LAHRGATSGLTLTAIEPNRPIQEFPMIRKTLLALALVAVTGTAFAQASGSMASDSGMAASPAASTTKAPAKHHHKKHVAKKAAASPMASDSGMAAPASDASGK